jgi:peptidyl-prolyl cis-trans isomerase SurA
MNLPKPRRARRTYPIFSVALLLTLAGCADAPPVADTSKDLQPYQATAPAATTASKPALAKPGVPLDRIAAVVNDDVILMSELNLRVALIEKQIAARGTTVPPEEVLRKQVLDQMVTTRIELQMAASKGVTVSDDQVNQTIKRIAASENISLEQFPDKLKAEGIEYNDFRADLRNQIIVHNLEQQVVNDQMRITPQEVDDQIRADDANGNSQNEYHLSAILIATPANPTPEQIAAAQKKAAEVYQKLKVGADFAATAIATSDDQQALKGGDLGWRKGAEVPTIFANLLQQMHAGDISAPFQSGSGFHIVKLDELKHVDNAVLVTQTHARHILVRPSALISAEQAKAKLEDLRKQILAGTDFAKLAQQNSDDPGSAPQGGDLGWTDPGTMVPEFEAETAKLQPGETSEVFQTQYGWHIVQVLGRRQADQSDVARKNKAYEAIFSRKTEEVLQHWLNEAKDAAFIEYHLDG